MKLKNLKEIRIAMMWLFLVSSSCTARNPAQITSTPMDLPTKQFAPSIPTGTDIAVNKDDMAECLSAFPLIYAHQIGFHDIYPGATTRGEVVNILGSPDKYDTTSDGEEYIYIDTDTQNANHIFIKNGVVSEVSVQSNDVLPQSLKDILEQFGCPVLILASASDNDLPDKTLTYDKTHLAYLEAGVWFVFDNYPLSYSNHPSTIGYEGPTSVKAYLEKAEYDLNKKIIVIVPFSEAIK